MYLKISNCGVTMLELNDIQPQDKIKVTDAAKIMGVTPMFLRLGLRQKCFPFGTAVKMNRRWAYYIHGGKFTEYMKGREVEEKKVEG